MKIVVRQGMEWDFGAVISQLEARISSIRFDQLDKPGYALCTECIVEAWQRMVHGEFHRIALVHDSEVSWYTGSGALVANEEEAALNLPYEQWLEEAYKVLERRIATGNYEIVYVRQDTALPDA